MLFSVNVDWQDYINKGWENKGRELLFNSCECKEGAHYKGYCEKCEISEDSAEPMMNYAYPLETTPDDEKILEVVKRTCCTVMYNSNEDTYYIALCGGGMNLSQDIALAYNILEKWVPLELALSTST